MTDKATITVITDAPTSEGLYRDEPSAMAAYSAAKKRLGISVEDQQRALEATETDPKVLEALKNAAPQVPQGRVGAVTVGAEENPPQPAGAALIREAAEDWYQGNLHPTTAMVIIYSMFHPQFPNDEDMRWARETLDKRKSRAGDVGSPRGPEERRPISSSISGAGPTEPDFCDRHELAYVFNEEQSKHFMETMMNPKPPPPAMIEAARKMAAWKRLPGDLEYDSWGK